MAERKWTPDQQNAINSRGGSLLLSAAAGSGKTAVLVERIVRLLTEGAEPVEPSQLLVVTFTNAAAAEMRSRIAAAIDGLIEKNPENSRYRGVKMKLPDACISTIDSFCIKLVRENFHHCGVEPDFRLIDEGEQRILRAHAMRQTLDDLCSENPELYDKLNSMTAYYRDDRKLAEKILRLYDFSLAHPFPHSWLDEAREMYRPGKSLTKSPWGKAILEEAVYTVEFCCALVEDAIFRVVEEEKVAEKYLPALKEALAQFYSLGESLEKDSWDEICEDFNKTRFFHLPKAPKGFGSNPVKSFCEDEYKRAVELIQSTAENFCVSEAQHRGDCEKLYPVITGLVEAVKAFGENYNRLKKEQNSYGFSDTMHMALALLAKDENGKITKTTLGYALSQQFREILIDEYQDTNEAQDMLFSMLSRDGGNLFTVGDVKQSIYRFRLAMPEIFVKKSREYASWDGEHFPAKIVLGTNFRSRKGILDNINFLFKRLMSDYAGEMTYGESEALYYGGGYDEEKEPAVELHILEKLKTEEEAEYVAKTIMKIMNSNATVTDKNGKRPPRPGDFCVLLRSTKEKGSIYEKILSENGINAYSEKKASLFDATEINVFMSLLKVINNPTDDVAMLSVMLSPLYGFTPDYVGSLKLSDKKRSFYACLLAVRDEDKRARELLEDLDSYRRMSAVIPFDIFMRTLLDITGYGAIVSSMNGGNERRLNLIILCEKAGEYMKNGGAGLGGFVRYIDRAVANGAQISAASGVSPEADVVRIYSIHKSKGLEYPFVIMADCGKRFNLMELYDDMIISSEMGAGMVMLNSDRLQKYPTLPHIASKLAVKRAALSEELRILYVAMTRARERLIMVGSVYSAEKEATYAARDATAKGRVPPTAVIKSLSYMRWLLMGYMTHPSMAGLTAHIGNIRHDYKGADSLIKVVVDDGSRVITENSEAAKPVSEAKAEIKAQIKERAEYVYPYRIPLDARPKRVASDFENQRFTPEYFAKSRPGFLSSAKLTPAQVGTANHIFLQCCDFGALSARDEVERLVGEGRLTKEQGAVIRLSKVESFLRSPLCQRIREAQAVYREKEFTAEILLEELYADLDDNVKNEKILVLGKADIIFVENGEAVVVDYKTDRSKTEEEFKLAYSGQLNIYAKAARQILEIPVKQSLIYALHLEKEIEI